MPMYHFHTQHEMQRAPGASEELAARTRSPRAYFKISFEDRLANHLGSRVDRQRKRGF